MANLNSFTAIDFETMTAERTSACAIGLVKVVDGHIIHKFYSLINPIPDHREQDNSAVNGITRDMVASAPDFLALWPTIRKIIGSDILVAHNAEFDRDVWNKQNELYCFTQTPEKFRFLCTYELTGLSLEAACSKHNIDISCHHDALDDAIACAKVMLAEGGHIQTSTFKGGLSSVLRQMEAKKYNRATLDPLDDSQVENRDTPFFHAKTVITGVFSAYPNRDELGRLLQSLGADINTSISKKTDIVVVGTGAGPSKMKKIEDLQADGHNIRIIFEPELISLLQ